MSNVLRVSLYTEGSWIKYVRNKLILLGSSNYLPLSLVNSKAMY